MAKKTDVKAASSGPAWTVDEPGARPLLIQRRLEVPPLPEHFAARPRVGDRLMRAIADNRICLVAAAAGAGKTTAVVEACRRSDRRLAWLTVDAPDAAPGRFLTYLEAALARCQPSVAGSVGSALASGATHAETAGLLAEAIGEEPTVLVLDELERIEASPDAWSVVQALLRYAPRQTAVVLVSRHTPPATVLGFPAAERLAVIGDDVLAFTVAEAADALDQIGLGHMDAREAVASAGGWVAGVLFQARAQQEEGPEPHLLHDYLAAEVIGRLPAELQEFLVTTSLLDEITAEGAQIFGYPDAAARLAAVRSLHLPATWDADDQSLSCHSAVREHLLNLLSQRSAGEVRAARLAHARLLASERHHEEAVEEFLAAGAPRESIPSAERCLTWVVLRMDFSVAERWLAALSEFHDAGLTVARLLIALARDELSRAVAIADHARQYQSSWPRSPKSEQAAYLMAWAYLHHARWEDVDDLAQHVAPGSPLDAIRFVAAVLSGAARDDESPAPPLPVWGPDEAMVNIAKYLLGRLTSLTETSDISWATSIRRPWSIAALRALGHTQRALTDFRAIESTAMGRATLLTFVAPDLFIDLGAEDEAASIIEEGNRLAALSGSLLFQGAARLAEAKFQLRIRDDVAAAHAVLDSPELRRASEGFPYMREVAQVWRGLAFLKADRNAPAIESLRAAVDGMIRGDRILELPTAAAYLAEACWRAGEETEFDRSADIALSAAKRQGSNHLLLQALEDVPAVVSRRLDAERSADSPWHEIGRARMTRPGSVATDQLAAVVQHEFGCRRLEVDGREVRLPIRRSYELLAYLTTRPEKTVRRDALLGVLFDDRDDASTRSYLRQAIRCLKGALPDSAIVVDTDTIALADHRLVLTESTTLEQQLQEAAGLYGNDRIDATVRALAAYERGAFLPGPRCAWADERERELDDLVADARAQAARIAVDHGRLRLARDMAKQVLERDPSRELAWQVLMRAAEAGGDQDGVTRAFRECENALREVGIAPSMTTRSLLERLRH
jgi:DNA-binding SARP family transcriptional activator